MSRRRDIPHSKKRIKQKRKIALWKFFIIFLVIALSLSGFIWGLSRPSLRITAIEVTGNNVLDTDEIVSLVRKEISGKYFYLFPKDSIILYPRERIKSDLLNFYKRILSLSVNAEGLTALSITINERKPYSLWCGSTLPETRAQENPQCYFTDETGFIFAEAPHFGDNVYIEFYGPLFAEHMATSSLSVEPVGSVYLSALEFKTIDLFRDLLSRTGLHTTKIASLDAGDVAFIIREGGKILLNKKQDPMKILSDLEAAFRTELGDPGDPLIRKQIEYIDARFANKIFFKKKK
ncbi:MAG: hypothetical protein Q7S11_02665 [bacterium]|nr:hypothetical protein [bacterium]